MVPLENVMSPTLRETAAMLGARLLASAVSSNWAVSLPDGGPFGVQFCARAQSFALPPLPLDQTKNLRCGRRSPGGHHDHQQYPNPAHPAGLMGPFGTGKTGTAQKNVKA